MRPRFRTDLKCSREEQQGVVFYRVDDPKTQTSFRLYEIEYLIAQKLDGKRELLEVIAAVKDEYNFDISEPDLRKFVSQLDSMGFVEKEPGAAGIAAPPVLGPGPEDPTIRDLEPIPESELLEPRSAKVDEAELKRLLKSALLHVRQGYIVHARDYFLAAKELNPSDARLAKLVSHLEIIGDSSGPAEVDYLWNQSKELFPDIAAEVEPLAEAKSTPGMPAPPLQSAAGAATAPSVSELRPDGDEEGGDSLKTRLAWLALLVLLVGGGGGALYWFARAKHVFEGTVRGTITTLKAQRLPVYYDKPAESVRAARETWLQFGAGGKVQAVKVKAGSRVKTDDVLVALAQPAALDKQLLAARAAAKKAEQDHVRATEKLEKLAKERLALEAERTQADKALADLQAKGASPSAAEKRDLAKWKKAKATVVKKLTAMQKKEKAPHAAEAAAKKKLEQVRAKLALLEEQASKKQIRAPFAGLVVEVSTAPGQTVNADQKGVLLRDNLQAKLTFTVRDAAGLTAGGEAFVSVARGLPSRAVVDSISAVDGGRKVEVTLTDPAGSFLDMAPTEFRLTREFVERAFEVPAAAVVTDAHGTRVMIELSGRALARPVEVLSRNAATAIVYDKSNILRDGDHLVLDRLGGEGGVGSIVDGSFLEVQQQN